MKMMRLNRAWQSTTRLKKSDEAGTKRNEHTCSMGFKRINNRDNWKLR